MAAVLVVDDEGDLLATYERLLRRLGCHVTGARTMAGALGALRNGRFELVVADRRLPDGDGLDIVRAARAVASPPPVIVVTAFVSGASRHQALAAGAAAYLAKPFTTASLASLVRDMLQRGRAGTPEDQESR
jgi:two-component system response regulator PilR (NtrC family)